MFAATQYSEGLINGLNETAQEARCAVCGKTRVSQSARLCSEKAFGSISLQLDITSVTDSVNFRKDILKSVLHLLH